MLAAGIWGTCYLITCPASWPHVLLSGHLLGSSPLPHACFPFLVHFFLTSPCDSKRFYLLLCLAIISYQLLKVSIKQQSKIVISRRQRVRKNEILKGAIRVWAVETKHSFLALSSHILFLISKHHRSLIAVQMCTSFHRYLVSQLSEPSPGWDVYNHYWPLLVQRETLTYMQSIHTFAFCFKRVCGFSR